jgi:hypothetical protein
LGAVIANATSQEYPPCYLACTSGEQPGVRRERGTTEIGEVTRHILATYEAGNLITTCAWCKRVAIDGEWLLPPRAALTAIDSPRALSHSICPQCASGAAPSDHARLAGAGDADQPANLPL